MVGRLLLRVSEVGGRFRWQVDPTGRYRSYVIRVGIRGDKSIKTLRK